MVQNTWIILKQAAYRLSFLLLTCCVCFDSRSQVSSIEFSSSDTALQNSFYRAKEMALSYKGDPGDPIGPWYEAALPSRNAFCIRDVSHQSIAAEILGWKAANKNMLTKLVTNISEAKDWCAYWEMNKFGKPAPEDYRNDREFWYNLNANFELIYTCWRLYLWTGDSSYITTPAFKFFFDRTVKDYLERWILQADSLLKRPAHPNAPVPYNNKDYFHSSRGLPSYNEAVADMRMGVDLVAAIYRAMKTYAAIALMRGEHQLAAKHLAKAEKYRQHLETFWWNKDARSYYTYFTDQQTFGRGEGGTYLLWYDALTDSSRIRSTIEHLLSMPSNVENLSYLPYQLCRYGYPEEAYRYILYLAHPATKRREYPEVSFGVIEGIVQGIMGVEADAPSNRLTTIYNNKSANSSELRNLDILVSRIDLKHWPKGSTLTNNGKKTINWRVSFHGRLSFIQVDGKKIRAIPKTNRMGNTCSYVDVKVLPGKTIMAILP